MRATFENSVDILVKAFFNDELRFMSCQACAVGNLISGNGYALTNKNNTQWLLAIGVCQRGQDMGYNEKIAREQVSASGYTLAQLDAIEQAFENTKGKYEDDGMFRGLMRVVDVLAEIHNISLEQKSVAKAMFVKETL